MALLIFCHVDGAMGFERNMKSDKCNENSKWISTSLGPLEFPIKKLQRVNCICIY